MIEKIEFFSEKKKYVSFRIVCRIHYKKMKQTMTWLGLTCPIWNRMTLKWFVIIFKIFLAIRSFIVKIVSYNFLNNSPHHVRVMRRITCLFVYVIYVYYLFTYLSRLRNYLSRVSLWFNLEYYVQFIKNSLHFLTPLLRRTLICFQMKYFNFCIFRWCLRKHYLSSNGYR